ncbi:GNAT family N-acetyltransferase [Polynucleobacter sp.]|uniref:GNAT family N-acetyltransferase n=1 Tax=Polynucleobacter sp. TaxID=2029855 RepID=UPI002732C148|nr:GNAT family N-acetyltransferase [Polynucleobacter sp.]MDP3121348.1 GNAT family N-acetyltransferase [Polynucleobacter sp.]
MITIETQSWLEARDTAYAIRYAVFVKEQGIPAELEIDDYDPIAEHALAFVDGECVATARIYLDEQDPSKAKIGRMAVLKEFRGQGIGTALLGEAIRAGMLQGASVFELHAQQSAVSFYAKLQFKPDGAIFDEVGIPHQRMRLVLVAPAP